MRRPSKPAPKPQKKKYDESPLIRINKLIADSGYCSRRKADELIAQGEVQVNRKIVAELGLKVRSTDFVTVEGNPIKTTGKHVYLLLNKPKDSITTTKDERDRKTVMDLVHSKYRVYPVGRLDRNTTGVLLLTNDGDLANRLTHPRYQIERVYRTVIDKPIEERHALEISQGVETDDFTSAPCEVFIDPKDFSKVTLVLREGKHHEVKRIFEAFGYFVKNLDRKMFAGLTVKGLRKGEFRHLTKQEVNYLMNLTKLNHPEHTKR
jgi:23S rRNA pseudouridine2605 synthase